MDKEDGGNAEPQQQGVSLPQLQPLQQQFQKWWLQL
jgi:hypothetical protein